MVIGDYAAINKAIHTGFTTWIKNGSLKKTSMPSYFA